MSKIFTEEAAKKQAFGSGRKRIASKK